MLGISRSTAYECIARGEIPAKRLGRRVVVVKAKLEAFLAEPDRPPRPPVRRLRSSA
jgi:excisionase family DNA binding protein